MATDYTYLGPSFTLPVTGSRPSSSGGGGSFTPSGFGDSSIPLWARQWIDLANRAVRGDAAARAALAPKQPAVPNYTSVTPGPPVIVPAPEPAPLPPQASPPTSAAPAPVVPTVDQPNQETVDTVVVSASPVDDYQVVDGLVEVPIAAAAFPVFSGAPQRAPSPGRRPRRRRTAPQPSRRTRPRRPLPPSIPRQIPPSFPRPRPGDPPVPRASPLIRGLVRVGGVLGLLMEPRDVGDGTLPPGSQPVFPPPVPVADRPPAGDGLPAGDARTDWSPAGPAFDLVVPGVRAPGVQAWPSPGLAGFPIPTFRPGPITGPRDAARPSTRPGTAPGQPQPVAPPNLAPSFDPLPFAPPRAAPEPAPAPRPRTPTVPRTPLIPTLPPGVGPALPSPMPQPFPPPAANPNPAADPCNCGGGKSKPKRKKREPRTVCEKGTYVQTARGVKYNPKETVPCQ